MKSNPQPIWGVLGGMGPRASAEFLNTIYEQAASGPEQQYPVVLLLSDPTMPDRTESLLNGKEQQLLERFSTGLNQLVEAGASQLVVCCMTIHPLIPKLPAPLRKKIVSLLDVMFGAVLRSEKRHLLLCTQGAMQSGLFHRHDLWPSVQEQVVLPKEDDLHSIHSLIYDIKSKSLNAGHLESLRTLLTRYQVSSYLAGCTEIHILAKVHGQAAGVDRRLLCIDPLTIIASTMNGAKSSETEPEDFSSVA